MKSAVALVSDRLTESPRRLLPLLVRDDLRVQAGDLPQRLGQLLLLSQCQLRCKLRPALRKFLFRRIQFGSPLVQLGLKLVHPAR